MFPEGPFYILSRKHGFALDVYDGQTKEDANIIVWPQKFQDSDNQLWTFDNGRLINKKSGHALDISSSAFKRDKSIVQKKIKPSKQSQEWIYDQGFICSKEFPTLVLDIRGDSPKGGAQVLLYKRKDTDNLNQLWQFEPYQQFEGALNLATTSVPLHKKEGFGQPRPGYGAEVGVPPELKQIPENNKIAGVGNNIAPTKTSNTTNEPANSRHDPLLAQYGSFYGGTQTSPSPAEPGPVPPLPPKYPPSSNSAPSPSAFPQPIPASSVPSTTYPPPASHYSTSPNQNSTGYPNYPPHDAHVNRYPDYPPAGFAHPPQQQQQLSMSPPLNGQGYPAPPLPNRNSQGDQYGYPPPPLPDRNSQNQYGYPPPPPSLPNRPQDQYGYPPSAYP